MKKKSRKHSYNKLFYIPLFVISSLLIFSPLFFKLQVQELKAFGFIGLFILNFLGSATIFFPVPSIISVGVWGNLYNPIIVACIAAFGSSLGEAVGYLFGHSSKHVLGLKKHEHLFHFLEYIFHKSGTLVIFITSFIPNPLFDGVGILVGMSNYSLKKFIFIVFLGRVLRNILIAQFGASL